LYVAKWTDKSFAGFFTSRPWYTDHDPLGAGFGGAEDTPGHPGEKFVFGGWSSLTLKVLDITSDTERFAGIRTTKCQAITFSYCCHFVS
jgi:hypothetical protein